ncbi:MAG: BrnT family toxin [Thermomicrobiales bacterium]
MDLTRFEWDNAKDAANRAKHGLTFTQAIAVFLDPGVVEEDATRPEFGEERLKATGMVDGRFVVVIFTYREDRRRITSARRARPDERQRYDKGFAVQ